MSLVHWVSVNRSLNETNPVHPTHPDLLTMLWCLRLCYCRLCSLNRAWRWHQKILSCSKSCRILSYQVWDQTCRDWISAGLVFTVRPERHPVQPKARDHITHSWRHFRSRFLPILHLIIFAALWLFCQMININSQSSVLIITTVLAVGTLLSWFLT